MEEADEKSASQEPVGQREDCKSGGFRELEDDLDIYRDMEQTSPVGDIKDPQSDSNFLPPPPEPPRMLVDFGKNDFSEEMDDSVMADICHKISDDSDCDVPCALSSPILESEIYDPAEPCMDSDDEIPVKPVYKVLEEDIPLPPGSPVGKLEESRTNVVSYSSTDSSGCESGSEVKLKHGMGETQDSSGQPAQETMGEEGSFRRLRPLSPSSPKCQTVSEEVAGVKVGENFDRHSDSRLSNTSSSDHLQKADGQRVTGEFSITDNLGRQSKSSVKICKVCSRACEGELLGVCKCSSESSPVRKGKGTGTNISSTSSSLSSSSSSSSSSNSICSSSSDSSEFEHSDKAVDCHDPKSGRDTEHKKKRKKKNQNLKSQKENVDTDGDFKFNSKRDKFCTGTSVMAASGKGIVGGKRCKNAETDVIDEASIRNTVENSLPDPAAQLGLEGLDTESISENEAFNFDDYCSQSENERDSGELDTAPPRKKRKLRNKLAGGRQSTSKSDIFKELDENISVPKLDWNSEEDFGKKVCDTKENRMMERKGKKYEKENAANDGTEVIKRNNFDKKSKKMNQAEIISNIECKDNTISWKKISLEGKERNYRDSKVSRSGEKEKEYHSGKGVSNKKEKKQKEKRKDIERYDVRKVLNDKRKIGDRFGRDQSREYSFSRSRSRSDGLHHSRSRSVSRSKVRSPNRYRHRSKSRSRSRSYKSRRRLKNKTGRKSKDRSRESFSREKRRMSKRERSRSRNRRGSKSRSRSRSWNRSRSRSVIKSRKRQERGRNSAKSSQRMRNKRSWSRTWTPSWSRSRSGSTTSSSFSRSCSPPPRKFNRSFTHSFSRSWSREPHEHIPIPKASTLIKSSKKHGVILAKPKDEEHHVKKGKKKKDSRAEKNKKRKERLIPPSKEVFTSGDNILVSVNFNKSTRSSGLKSGESSILSSSCLSLPSKITSKHSHLDESFEITKELTKKPKKEIISGDKILEDGANVDNAGDAVSKQKKKVKKSLKEDKRFAAILKQKPIAIIDLDHSPFKERTPSPTDLIVLSDSNEEGGNNDSKVVGENTSNPELKKLCLDIPSPPKKPETIHRRASDVSLTTGPKTPPEPPSKSNVQAKNKLEVSTLPSRDDSVQSSEKDFAKADEFDEHNVTCPAPQANTALTDISVSSPGVYDPFDPTKSATPSPGGQESGADTAMNMSSISDSHHAEEGNSLLTSDTPEVPDKSIEAKSSETSAECVSTTNSEQGTASVLLDATRNSPKVSSECKQVPLAELNMDVNVDVNNTVVNMEIDETDNLICSRLTGESTDKDRNTTQTPLQQVVTTTVTQISAECLATSVKCNEIPVKPDLVSNNSKLHMPLASTPIKHLQQAPHVTPPRNLAFLQLPPSLSAPLIHQPQLQPMLPTHHNQPKLPLLSTPVSKKPDCQAGPFNVSSNVSLDQGLFLTSTPVATSKDGSAVPNISNISAIANYLVNSLAVTPQNPVLNTPLLKQLNISDTSHHTSLASIPTPPAHNGDRKQQKTQDTTEVVDMDLDSPYSPASSEGDDLFEPPPEMVKPPANFPPVSTKLSQQPLKSSKPIRSTESNVLRPLAKTDPLHTLFSSITKSSHKPNLHTSSKGNTSLNKSKDRHTKSTRKEIHIKRAADQLEILDELPSSAVELQVKEKFLKKLNRQERVVDEVKIALKPHYTKKYITKEEYKDILRRAVPKICHNEPGEINPTKVSSLIEAYVKKYRYAKKKFGSHGDKDKSSKNVM